MTIDGASPEGSSDSPAPTNAMLTGADYLASLDDGREVWYDGERVTNVTTHPAFANSARTIAGLYDALHSPDTAETLTTVDRSGNVRFTTFKNMGRPLLWSGDLAASKRVTAYRTTVMAPFTSIPGPKT